LIDGTPSPPAATYLLIEEPMRMVQLFRHNTKNMQHYFDSDQ